MKKYEIGHIVKTSPLANTKRTVGTEITLWVSEGDTKITLEDFIGSNYLEVKGRLEALGILVNIDYKDAKENSKNDLIVETVPKAGEKVSKGDTVILYLPTNKYPDFVKEKYTYERIVDYLKDFNVTVEKEERESKEPTGTVIEQSRKAGTRIVGGTTIKITVAKAKQNNEDDQNTPCTGDLC